MFLSHHSALESSSNQVLNQSFDIDSNSDMIPEKQIVSAGEKCPVCRQTKKFDIIHKKTLNLNDSAILSFSINSNNSKALNRSAHNEVKYFKENCSNLPMDNQEYFYCYSTILTPQILTNSNLSDSGCLRENVEPDANRQIDGTERRTRNKLRKAKQTKNQNCCLSCFCCCSNLLAKTKLCIFMNIINTKVKNLVDGNFFQRAILFSILINTFCMGIEHHQQVILNFRK